VFQDGANYKFAIQQVNAGPDDRMTIRAREWQATSVFDRRPSVMYGFYVRNARQSRAMAGNASAPFEGMGGIPLMFFAGVSHGEGPSDFFVRVTVVSFPHSYGMENQQVEWDPAWYAGAELVIVRMTNTGAVLRTLVMPRASVVAKK
jgi:hypothetical protein